MELKKEILTTQMSSNQSENPNGIDNIAPRKQNFPQFENLKATLKADT